MDGCLNYICFRCAIIVGVIWLLPHFAVGETVVAWGDSLTAGAGGTAWTTQFATLSGISTLNRGVGGNTSTQIEARFMAEPSHFGDFTVIWAGRNNYTDPTTVQSDIASMVSALTTTRYLILGVINGNYGGYESVGGEGYGAITQLNSDLAAIYGSHFIDIREILVSSYNPLSSQDVSDLARDIVPTSLRSDNVHLNTTGYGIVANAVYTEYLAMPEPNTLTLLSVSFLLVLLKRIRYRVV